MTATSRESSSTSPRPSSTGLGGGGLDVRVVGLSGGWWWQVTLDLSEDRQSVLNVLVQVFDTVPVATGLCITKTGLLFVASEFSNHVLYQFQGIDDPEAVSANSLDESETADEDKLGDGPEEAAQVRHDTLTTTHRHWRCLQLAVRADVWGVWLSRWRRPSSRASCGTCCLRSPSTAWRQSQVSPREERGGARGRQGSAEWGQGL